MQNRIKLLISPKNLEEAKVVVKHSDVDYIDCKNPSEGSLGANFPWIIKSMKNLIPLNSSQLLSATIGDFPNLPGSASLAALGAAVREAIHLTVGFYIYIYTSMYIYVCTCRSYIPIIELEPVGYLHDTCALIT